MVEASLHDLLTDAARGKPPSVDFETELLGRPNGPVSAVLAFTGHHVVAADVDRPWFEAARDPHDFGSVMRAPFLAALGDRVGARVGHFDLVLVAPPGSHQRTDRPEPGVDLVETDPRTDGHLRVRRALAYRRDVQTFRTADGAGVLMLGRGLAGRWEIAFEVEPAARGRGLGRALATAAGTFAPMGAHVFAQVSPGNVASLRVLLAAGYRPIGSEVLLLHPE